MAPKCTGIWGAFDTKPPSGPNNAQEKSKRSLILVDIDVLWSILKYEKTVWVTIIFKFNKKIIIFTFPFVQQCSWTDEKKYSIELVQVQHQF